ncbi:MAG: O-acetyl-ADP-ribose deacetylase [Vulcanimicrobiota bacterium]
MTTKLQVEAGDLTRLRVDAIVNAANTGLRGGGGVDGAIHRAGGPTIMEECDAIRARQGGCATGEAVLTSAGNMPARHVIHTVGPVWRGGQSGEEQLLANCYRNSLRLALEQGLKTVAFPCISTGVYGYPPDQAAPLAVQTVREFCRQHPGLEVVTFCVFSPKDEQLYSQLLKD